MAIAKRSSIIILERQIELFWVVDILVSTFDFQSFQWCNMIITMDSTIGWKIV